MEGDVTETHTPAEQVLTEEGHQVSLRMGKIHNANSEALLPDSVADQCFFSGAL